MNYGEQQIRRKIKILASPKSRIVNRVKLYSIICFIILLFASLLVLAFCAAGVLRGLVDSAPVLSEVELMPSGYATTIYDADGNVTQTLVG